MPLEPTSHWLDLYGNSEAYQWQKSTSNGRTIFYRPLGLVEFAFDADGRYYEGRADMNAQLDLAMRSNLGNDELRRRIQFAWATLQNQHPMAKSRAVSKQDYMKHSTDSDDEIYFAVDLPNDLDDALRKSKDTLVFLDDYFNDVDEFDFFLHSQNTARVIKPEECLAKLFVLPLDHRRKETPELRFLLVSSHQIQDGLSNFAWLRSFIHILNQPLPELEASLKASIEPSTLQDRLPPPQEALYPEITGSRARQRWFWVMTRILRHVRTPHTAGFPNPLRRSQPLKTAMTLSPVYASVLDYSRPPVLNTYLCNTKASRRATDRLHSICRRAGVSVGAGCFALAALIMMEFYERRDPDVSLSERKPFITGFPLNPRPFLNTPVEPDSLMLAFSDGIQLPFLPSNLPLEGRIRLLARQAQKQLASYQKRIVPAADKEGLQYMGSRGAGRVLATQYISSFERSNGILPPGHRRPGPGPQGAYPMRPNATTQTCGVSSVGRRDTLIKRGMYDVDADAGKDFVVDFRDMKANVRVRDGEFLVGVGGADDGLFAAVSVDTMSLDPRLVEEWRVRFESILEDDSEAEVARL